MDLRARWRETAAMNSMDPDFFHLAVALGIGLLFGAERGWQ